MSNYPIKIDVFSEKLNKSETVYVIEEEVTVTDGIYEAPLRHDNVVDTSVRVYTGSKLTGERIDNFILSIPEGMRWKRIIKIFTTIEEVYISYETTGDQVEAEDINNLQESMTATQIEVERYKAANNLVVTNTVNRVTTIENKKAEKTYLDTELLKKADKVNTYSKTETDERIKSIIGAAPDALDTLQELGEALNNDPNFAATMTAELAKKVDKVTGKQLTTEDYTTAEKTKLAGVETGANKYIHPSTHPATMIVEDASHRFVSDIEKANWNGKLDKTGGTLTGPLTIQDSEISTQTITFDGTTAAGFKVKNLNGYVNIAPLNSGWAHIYSDREKFIFNKPVYTVANTFSSYLADLFLQRAGVTKLTLGLLQATFADEVKAPSFVKTDGSVIETTNGAQDKVNTHANDAEKHITAAERTAWNGKSTLALGETPSTAYRGDRGKVAYEHSQVTHAPSAAQKNSDITKAEIEAKLTGVIATHTHSQYVTKSELGDAGYGDMIKNIYDTNGNGIVDAAESAPWNGISGKPSTFTPTAHNHSTIQKIDDRDRKPADTAKGFAEIVFTSLAGMSGASNSDYQDMIVLNTYTDTSGGNVNALVFDKSEMLIRHYQALQTATDWGTPKTLAYAEDVMKKGAKTWNDLKGV